MIKRHLFCARCIKKQVKTGYTKRNDLVHHLEKCGLEIEKKFICDWKDCTKSFVRFSNLRQHVAKDHTKEKLYHCKKCKQGFFTSLEATAHRKLYYPSSAPVNPSEDVGDEDKGDDNGKKRKKGRR